MSEQVPIEVTEAAADWLDVLLQDEASLEQREEFVDWLTRSPVHVEEFLQISAIHNELSGSLSAFPEWAAELLASDDEGVVHMANVGVPEKYSSECGQPEDTAVRPKHHTGAWFAIAATLLMTVSLGFWLTQYGLSSRLETEIGEQRLVILDDGSRLQLNTNSEVDVQFSDSVREIELLRGELMIQVQKEFDRPFIVRTDAAAIQATGTQFNVYKMKHATEVTVIEGRVLVDWSTGLVSSQTVPTESEHSMSLGAGEKTLVAEKDPAPQSIKVDIANATAWTERRLIFDNESVATVANEFNRYNKRQILVADTAFAERRISGVFDMNDPAAFIALLASLDALEVQDTKDGNRKLTPRADEEN